MKIVFASTRASGFGCRPPVPGQGSEDYPPGTLRKKLVEHKLLK